VLLAANTGACSVKFVFRIVGFADGVEQAKRDHVPGLVRGFGRWLAGPGMGR
jgi:hypothetical protein